MRQANVYYKGDLAGWLSQFDDGSFVFEYTEQWFENTNKPSISLSLPKSKRIYKLEFLFHFFYSMLPEGTNKQTVCKLKRIDSSDYFGLLMATATHDTIGAVTVQKTEEQAWIFKK